MTITEADRAVARRIIRRIAGVGPSAAIEETSLPAGRAFERHSRFQGGGRVYAMVDFGAIEAGALAAAQGRSYAKALRGAS